MEVTPSDAAALPLASAAPALATAWEPDAVSPTKLLPFPHKCLLPASELCGASSSSNMNHHTLVQATRSRQYLLSIGVPSHRIIIFKESGAILPLKHNCA